MHLLDLPTTIASYLAPYPVALDWLTSKAAFCKKSTVESYAYSIAKFVRFCVAEQIDYTMANDTQVIRYIASLDGRWVVPMNVGNQQKKLSVATQRKLLSALTLYFNYMKAIGIRSAIPLVLKNDAPKNKYGKPRLSLIQAEYISKWIPTQEQWHVILTCMKATSLRNNLMLLLSYECALRKNELCTLRVSDVQGTIITLRAGNTKMNRERRVQFSQRTRRILDLYLRSRPTPSPKSNEGLFLSESTQNWGQQIKGSAWRKVIDSIAKQADCPLFTPHTIRHLSITHFSNQGHDAEKVARFAGHRNPSSTDRYRHYAPEHLLTGVARAISLIATAEL